MPGQDRPTEREAEAGNYDVHTGYTPRQISLPLEIRFGEDVYVTDCFRCAAIWVEAASSAILSAIHWGDSSLSWFPSKCLVCCKKKGQEGKTNDLVTPQPPSVDDDE